MRGQPAIPVFFRSGLRATPFLDAKKGGKRRQGAKPLNPWRLAGFLFRKAGGKADT